MYSFMWIPQTVLRFLGTVHVRARGPREQHTQASETPQGLNKTKRTQLQSALETSKSHLLEYCSSLNVTSLFWDCISFF